MKNKLLPTLSLFAIILLPIVNMFLMSQWMPALLRGPSTMNFFILMGAYLLLGILFDRIVLIRRVRFSPIVKLIAIALTVILLLSCLIGAPIDWYAAFHSELFLNSFAWIYSLHFVIAAISN